MYYTQNPNTLYVDPTISSMYYSPAITTNTQLTQSATKTTQQQQQNNVNSMNAATSASITTNMGSCSTLTNTPQQYPLAPATYMISAGDGSNAAYYITTPPQTTDDYNKCFFMIDASATTTGFSQAPQNHSNNMTAAQSYNCLTSGYNSLDNLTQTATMHVNSPYYTPVNISSNNINTNCSLGAAPATCMHNLVAAPYCYSQPATVPHGYCYHQPPNTAATAIPPSYCCHLSLPASCNASNSLLYRQQYSSNSFDTINVNADAVNQRKCYNKKCHNATTIEKNCQQQEKEAITVVKPRPNFPSSLRNAAVTKLSSTINNNNNNNSNNHNSNNASNDSSLIMSFRSNILYKTIGCREFERFGTCPRGNTCQFAHGVSDMRSPNRHPLFRTKICAEYTKSGKCPRGLKCYHAHAFEELRLIDDDIAVASSKSNSSGSAIDSSYNTSGTNEFIIDEQHNATTSSSSELDVKKEVKQKNSIKKCIVDDMNSTCDSTQSLSKFGYGPVYNPPRFNSTAGAIATLIS